MNTETLQTARNLERFVLEQIKSDYENSTTLHRFEMELRRSLLYYCVELDRRKALALEYAAGTLPDRRKTPRLTHYAHLTEVSES